MFYLKFGWVQKTHTHLTGENIPIKFTATFVEFYLCYKTRCIGNYLKPLRKNIHGLRCNWFCFFFGEKVIDDLWEKLWGGVEKHNRRLHGGMIGELCVLVLAA